MCGTVASEAESLLLDPAVNAEIRRLREQVKEAQAELEASQFSAGSLAGKKLMQKCKDLQTENEQLGKELSDGRLQKLRAEVAAVAWGAEQLAVAAQEQEKARIAHEQDVLRASQEQEEARKAAEAEVERLGTPQDHC